MPPNFKGDEMFCGGAWLLSAKIGSQGIQFLLFFLAARALAPGDFGMYAVCAAVMTLLTIVAEAGWAEQLLRLGYCVSLFRNISALSFWTAAIISAWTILAAIGIYLAGHIPAAILLAVWSISIVPCTVATAYEAAFTAQGRLGTVAWLRLSSELAGLACTAICLLIGLGVTSLAIGKVASQSLALLIGCLRLGCVPSFRVNVADAFEYARFSRHIVFNRLILFAGSYSSTFAVAGFLGVAEAAYFRAAERLVGAISEAFGEPIRATSWVAFREASMVGRDQLRRRTAVTVVMSFAIAVPVFVTLLLYSKEVVDLLLGDRWSPSAPLVSILCVRQLLLLPGYFNEPLLSVTGSINRRWQVTLVNVSALVLVGFVAAPYSAATLAISQCAVAAFSLTTTARLQHSSGGIDWIATMRLLSSTVLPSVAVMLASENLIAGRDIVDGLPSLAHLAARLAFTTAVYAAVVAILYWIVIASVPAQKRTS